jgi:hypothetical protein
MRDLAGHFYDLPSTQAVQSRSGLVRQHDARAFGQRSSPRYPSAARPR